MSLSLLNQHTYTISDIKLLNHPISRSKILKHIFRIEITPSKMFKSATGIINKNHVYWNENVSLDVTPESAIVFRIHRKKINSKTKIFAEYTSKLSCLLDMKRSSGICEIDLGEKGQLHFTIKVQERLSEAMQHIENIRLNEGEAWTKFLAYFQTVEMAVDPVSGLNPYVQRAWNVLSAIPNIIQTHFTRNSNINKLLRRLMNIFAYIADASRLHVLTNTQREKLKLLIDKSYDCAYFIRDYTENNAAEKVLKGPCFDVEISKFNETLDELFDTIQRCLTLETNTATNEIRDFNLLREMPYAENAGFIDGKKCLPGTREKLINEILEWVDNKDAPERVFVLSGQAGMGKSAVAHTITETFRTQNRLCSLFCFSRSDKDRRNLLFSTISRDLADGNVSWRRNLVRTIEVTAIRQSLDPVTQFNEMIIKPSRGVEMTRPVVIVIDALDESGDRFECETLLDLLFQRSSELQTNYRFMITTRPETNIASFYQHSNVLCKHMTEVDSQDTFRDIRQFISHKLFPVKVTLDEEVKMDWCSLLAEKAQGLFQWANLACLYINPTVTFGLGERLRIIISRSTSSIYELYHEILDNQPEFCLDGYSSMFQMIIGAIVIARKPLSVIALQALFGHATKDVKSVLRPFHSLFIGLDDSAIHIRPLHASLLDFFISAEQKPGIQNRYYVDTSDQSFFTHACLRVMNGLLRFNICGLETSHLRNRDVPDFNLRVAEAVPLHLSYACCFWAYHLENSRLTSNILGEIHDLMDNKLLYLFEALSLLGEVEHGRTGMQILKNKTKDEDGDLAARAAEVSQFAFEFGEMMMESTPHLYLSSLPYISKHSYISQQFIPQYPQLLSVDVGRFLDLRPEVKDSIVQRHPFAKPTAVAFSPHGRQIAAGFDNGDFWVWDYVTGEMLCRLSPEQKAVAVCNVVFSLNGERAYCCFKDGGILTWEGKSKKTVYESNEGLINGECDRCTISSDGRYIAFQVSNLRRRLCFYERVSCSRLFEENLGYDTRMLFSPSERLFGFQNEDGVLRLWDTQMKTLVSHYVSITKPWMLEALTDGYMVADTFKAHEIWDIRTSTKVRRLEPEPKSRAKSTFMANGKYLLLSEGNKHLVWNIVTEEIMQHFVGRDGDCTSVAAVSPDSKYIAFAFNGSTTHVLAWDDFVQGEMRNLGEGNGVRGRDAYCSQAWLKGHHILSQVWNCPPSWKRYLQILNTTRNTGLNVDFKVEIDGRLLFEISPEENHWSIAYVDGSRACVLRLWNIDEKKEIVLDKSGGKVITFTFSATGDHLISVDSAVNIKIWDVRTHQLISYSRLSVPNLEQVTALAFCPTGTTFFVAYDTLETAFIEERECSDSQRIVNGPFTHNSTISSILVVSNNTHIYVCSESRNSSSFLEILNRSTGASTNRFNTHLSPTFSSDRRYIAWVLWEDRHKMELWDAEKGITLDRIPFSAKAKSIRFSNDSKRISILCDAGETDRFDIWDIGTKKLVMRLFFNNFSSRIWAVGGLRVGLYEDSLLLVDNNGMGRIWSPYVHEIMTSLYDDNPDSKNGRSIQNYKLSSEIIEALKYARVAWKNASFSPLSKLEKDGWMLGPHGELSFWVPQKMRKSLWYPCMTHMVPEGFTKLNFDKFVYGTRWAECKIQPKP